MSSKRGKQWALNYVLVVFAIYGASRVMEYAPRDPVSAIFFSILVIVGAALWYLMGTSEGE